jgi:hypothetical protein
MLRPQLVPARSGSHMFYNRSTTFVTFAKFATFATMLLLINKQIESFLSCNIYCIDRKLFILALIRDIYSSLVDMCHGGLQTYYKTIDHTTSTSCGRTLRPYVIIYRLLVLSCCLEASTWWEPLPTGNHFWP